MKTEAFGCGCFVKVYVCPEHLGVAGRQLEEKVTERFLQCELREGREASEDGDVLFGDGNA